MKTRIITAIVGILIGVLLFLFGEMNSIVLTAAISLVSAVMCGEYLSAKQLHKDMKIFIPCLLFAFLIPMLSYTVIGLLPVFLFALYIAVIAVAFHESVALNDLMFSFFGILIISGSMALFTVRMCALNYRPTMWGLMILGVPWIADSAAYFIGSAMGKRKLCPVISPKKTVEGAVGGVLCGTLAPFLLALICMLIYGEVRITWWILPVIGLVNSVISIVGDLLFSVVKRSCGVKDYGSIMPGHGGLLDRFDSVILCVPVVYMISQWIEIIA